MQTREEKNKDLVKEIKKEKRNSISNKIIKLFFICIFIFIIIYFCIRYVGTSFIQNKEYIIKDTNIPKSFHGVKILHFSDLLYGSTIDEKDLIKLNKNFIKINPDIVIFTGDIVDKKYNLKDNDIKLLNNFFKDIPYTIGKYLVIGENDTNFETIINDTNFNYLNNQYTLAYYGQNEPIAILGFNSNQIEDIDVSKIFEYYKISLIHNFDMYNQNIESNLILAGHNLNGEIYLGKGLLGENKYNDSFYIINNTPVYISNGLGSLHKLRLFNHPSFNVYRLLKY